MKNLKVKFTASLCFLVLVLSSCSSDESNDLKSAIPEKFIVKVEIKSASGSSSLTSIQVNSTVVKDWKNITLPFSNEYTYITKGDEASSTACGCITISAWAYLNKADKIQSFNLYVNGELVNSTSIVAEPETNGTINPTKLNFVYKP